MKLNVMLIISIILLIPGICTADSKTAVVNVSTRVAPVFEASVISTAGQNLNTRPVTEDISINVIANQENGYQVIQEMKPAVTHKSNSYSQSLTYTISAI